MVNNGLWSKYKNIIRVYTIIYGYNCLTSDCFLRLFAPLFCRLATMVSRSLKSIYNLNFKIMSNLRNSVRLIGFLGGAPEVKEISKTKKLAKMSIATNESYKNEKGEKVEETHWHNLVLWDKQADIAAKYLVKGSEIAIEGKLATKSYSDKDGVKRYYTEIVVNEVLMLGKNKS